MTTTTTTRELHKITYKKAKQLLTEIIAEKGADYIYAKPDGGTRCFYFHGGKPSCIVGHLLHRLGVEQEMLSVLENAYGFSGPTRELVRKLTGAEFTPKASKFLSQVQMEHDAGRTWGVAFDNGVTVVKTEYVAWPA